MSYFSDERVELKALMNLFIAISKLSKYYSFDQAIDVLDIYFKTNNEKVLTENDDIRYFVVSNNIRDFVYPLIVNEYDGLYEFLNQFTVKKGKANSK